MGGACSMLRVGERATHSSVGNFEGKGTFGRHKYRWEDNVG